MTSWWAVPMTWDTPDNSRNVGPQVKSLVLLRSTPLSDFSMLSRYRIN